jgi:hypothetical protein
MEFPAVPIAIGIADHHRSINTICENQRDQREKEKKSSHKVFLTIFTIKF